MNCSMIFGAALLVSTSTTLAIDSRAGAAGAPAWTDELQAVDDAIAARDAGKAQRALQRAYFAAVASRRWDAMLAVGDAARRLAEVGGSRAGGIQWARRCYLAALFRARDVRALDGVAEAVERFAGLGDRDIVMEMSSDGYKMLETNAPNLHKKYLIPGAGHWIQQERPTEISQLLIEFLKEL